MCAARTIRLCTTTLRCEFYELRYSPGKTERDAAADAPTVAICRTRQPKSAAALLKAAPSNGKPQPPASQASSSPQDTVQLSPAAQAGSSSGDVDHEGDPRGPTMQQCSRIFLPASKRSHKPLHILCNPSSIELVEASELHPAAALETNVQLVPSE
jgi:hypothetical protein